MYIYITYTQLRSHYRPLKSMKCDKNDGHRWHLIIMALTNAWARTKGPSRQKWEWWASAQSTEGEKTNGKYRGPPK